MGIFGIFEFLAPPLGWILEQIYKLVNNYFIAIFLFVVLMRILMFPLFLQSQKKQAQRIRLAPRLEQLQKKYKSDPKKLQEKQQALYEKEGVSLTGGCLPMLIPMILLIAIISVIYKPLSYLSPLEKGAVTAAETAVIAETYTAENSGYEVDEAAHTATAKDGTVIDLSTKLTGNDASTSSYYIELNTLRKVTENEKEILARLRTDLGYDEAKARETYQTMVTMGEEFSIGSVSLLETPWDGSTKWLWLIPIISGITALISAFISQYYSKQGMSKEKQPGQGCTNVMTLGFMPAFSLYISFIVPGAVGIYWIFSNLVALAQTVILNKIYDPKKIREQAEIEYEERRRLKAEAKKNALAEARRRDDEAERQADEAYEQDMAQRKADEAAGKKPPRKLPVETGDVKLDEDE